MNVRGSVSFLIIIFIETGIPTRIARQDVENNRYAEVDLLLEDLEQWTEGPCYKAMHDLLHGVKNSTLWASWTWDSMQRPTGTFYGSRYNLGNYNQCLNPPWKTSHPDLQTKYCLVDVQITDEKLTERNVFDPYSHAGYYLGSENINGRRFNVVTMGVCVPAVCSEHTAARIASALTGVKHIQDPEAAKCQPHQQQYGWKFYAFIGAISGLILITLSSTFYLEVRKNSKNDRLASIAKPFCIKTNLNDLMKVNNKEIRILHGMRFITAFLTILVHVISYLMMVSLSNIVEFDEDSHNKISSLAHSNVIIETFLAMSGLLYAKSLLANKNQNLVLALFKRYLRLIGPYATATLFVLSVYEFIGSGPIWEKFSSFETGVCSQYWWLNLLMINSDMSTMCYPVTWYISVDYQLAVAATIIFYIYRKDSKAGYITFLSAFTLAAMIPGMLTYWNNYSAICFDKVTDMFSVRVKEDMNQIYVKSYCRAGSYLVGVAMGYIMTSYTPQKHRNTISKTWSYIGSIISFVILLRTMSIGTYFLNRTYDPLESAISMALNRTTWAIAICGFITFSEYGSIPYITNFLSWKVFVPLSRLSYGIYIIHTFLIQRKMFSIRNPLQYDAFHIILDLLGVTVLSVFLSLCLYLIVEAPLIRISQQLTARPLKQINNGEVQNDYTARNGNGSKCTSETKIE